MVYIKSGVILHVGELATINSMSLSEGFFWYDKAWGLIFWTDDIDSVLFEFWRRLRFGDSEILKYSVPGQEVGENPPPRNRAVVNLIIGIGLTVTARPNTVTNLIGLVWIYFYTQATP